MLIAFLVVLSMSAPCDAAPILLAEIHHADSVGYGNYPYVPEPVTFGLRWGYPWPTPKMWSEWWYSGETGSYDFTADSHEAFAVIAAGITNEEDDYLDVLWSRNPLSSTHAHSVYESAWGLGDPDLQGFEIDVIHLNVEQFDAAPGSFDCAVTWQFWGTPEPSVVVFLYAALVPWMWHRHFAHDRANVLPGDPSNFDSGLIE